MTEAKTEKKPSGRNKIVIPKPYADIEAALEKEYNYCKLGPFQFIVEDLPEGEDDKEEKNNELKASARNLIASILQSEHLSLLVGNGLTIAINGVASKLTEKVNWSEKGLEYGDKVEKHAKELAKNRCKDSTGNSHKVTLEDSLQAAIKLINGLEVIEPNDAETWRQGIHKEINKLITGILGAEKEVNNERLELLTSFLLALANRPATRDRLNIFTTNYDRLIEYGCDKAGIRIMDRFLGSIEPTFNSTRLNLDMHYNPPGINEDPRYLHGVVRLTKLHGSLDWVAHKDRVTKAPVGFGDTSFKPKSEDNIMIYPNPSKDMDSIHYPYSELFRDLAAAICRPNSTLVVYGYGFGDEHVNRIIRDMLSIQSTHLLIIHHDEGPEDRGNLIKFVNSNYHSNQVNLMVGKELAEIETLVNDYLPSFPLDDLRNKANKIIEKTKLIDDDVKSNKANKMSDDGIECSGDEE